MAKKINSDVMKQNNRNEVLRLIRKGPRSRIKLAEKTGLTRAAISFITEELLAEGLIVEGEKSPSIGGRPATLLQINGDYGVYGGVHFTRNEYAVGVCDFTGRLLKEERGRVEANEKLSSTLREKIRAATRTVYRRTGLKGIVRMDFLVSGEEYYLGEVNTVPGSLAYYLFCERVSEAKSLFGALIEDAILEKPKRTPTTGVLQAAKLSSKRGDVRL